MSTSQVVCSIPSTQELPEMRAAHVGPEYFPEEPAAAFPEPEEEEVPQAGPSITGGKIKAGGKRKEPEPPIELSDDEDSEATESVAEQPEGSMVAGSKEHSDFLLWYSDLLAAEAARRAEGAPAKKKRMAKVCAHQVAGTFARTGFFKLQNFVDAFEAKSEAFKDPGTQWVFVQELHQDGCPHVHFYMRNLNKKLNFETSLKDVEGCVEIYYPEVEEVSPRYFNKDFTWDISKVQGDGKRWLQYLLKNKGKPGFEEISSDGFDLEKEATNPELVDGGWLDVVMKAPTKQAAVAAVFALHGARDSLRSVHAIFAAWDEFHKKMHLQPLPEMPAAWYNMETYDERIKAVRDWVDRYVRVKPVAGSRRSILLIVGPTRIGKTVMVRACLRDCLRYCQSMLLLESLLASPPPEWEGLEVPVVLDDPVDDAEGGHKRAPNKAFTQTTEFVATCKYMKKVRVPCSPLIVIANQVPEWYSPTACGGYWYNKENCVFVEFPWDSQPLCSTLPRINFNRGAVAPPPGPLELRPYVAPLY